MNISKVIKKSILSLTLLTAMATSFQSQAFVGIATGNPALAVGGLILAPTGVMLGSFAALGDERSTSGLLMLGGIIGIIMLDSEDGQKISFQQIPEKNLLRMGLTEDEATAFNDNSEELSTAFNIVSSNLDQDSTKEDAVQAWQEQEDILGIDAINGARKVLQFNINRSRK